MAEIVSLAAEKMRRQDHLEGEARCASCGHTWHAMASIGTVELECPGCGSEKGFFVNGCIPATTWVCSCGCYLFAVDECFNIICYNCGTYQEIAT